MLWIHKGYCVVKKWCEMFVLKLSGIQILLLLNKLPHLTKNMLLFKIGKIYKSLTNLYIIYLKVYELILFIQD